MKHTLFALLMFLGAVSFSVIVCILQLNAKTKTPHAKKTLDQMFGTPASKQRNRGDKN